MTLWLAVANLPICEVNETCNQLIPILTILSVVILLAVILTIFMIVKKVTAPIKKLTNGVENFS